MSAVSEGETLAALTCRGNNMYFIIFMACFLSSSVNIGRVKLEAHGPDLVHRFLVPPPGLNRVCYCLLIKVCAL